MAKFVVDVTNQIPGDGKVNVNLSIEGINPKNEAKAEVVAEALAFAVESKSIIGIAYGIDRLSRL